MQIDYLYGAAVTEVIDIDGDGGWALKFNNDGVLTNLKPFASNAPDVVGATLQRAVFDAEGTVLYFDNGAVVNLDPLNYAVGDSVETMSIPQASEIQMAPVPDDPSTERVADGPSQEWLDSQEEDDNASDQDS